MSIQDSNISRATHFRNYHSRKSAEFVEGKFDESITYSVLKELRSPLTNIFVFSIIKEKVSSDYIFSMGNKGILKKPRDLRIAVYKLVYVM